jgi:hypothetical protein
VGIAKGVIVVFLSTVCWALMLQAQTAPKIVQGTLIAPGSAPFHLSATVSDGTDATIEMWWIRPDKWRRRIVSNEFAQTIVVNGTQVYEHDSDNYFPVGLEVLASAMVDPGSLLAEYKPGGILLTKANGAAAESGITCFDAAAHKMCLPHAWGLTEMVGVPGKMLEFTKYQPFHGRRIARKITYTISVGNFFTGEVIALDDLKNVDETLFAIPNPTPREQQLVTATLPETELRGLAVESPRIIWPQALDGVETGQASFYLTLDPTGKVRDVLPVKTCNERTNDSAIRQIKSWKFKPATKDGFPVQGEGILNFDVNTRAFGPAQPLTDVETRKMASNIVECGVSAGEYPPGTVYKLAIAVDIDGGILEKIAVGGPGILFSRCDAALRQWHFQPIMEDGQPRPYRGLVEFHIP